MALPCQGKNWQSSNGFTTPANLPPLVKNQQSPTKQGPATVKTIRILDIWHVYTSSSSREHMLRHLQSVKRNQQMNLYSPQRNLSIWSFTNSNFSSPTNQKKSLHRHSDLARPLFPFGPKKYKNSVSVHHLPPTDSIAPDIYQCPPDILAISTPPWSAILDHFCRLIFFKN